MSKLRYPRREPTEVWQQLRPLFTDPAQLTYEMIRPVLLFGTTPKERARETGMSARTIYACEPSPPCHKRFVKAMVIQLPLAL
jgi:hypothetical protein